MAYGIPTFVFAVIALSVTTSYSVTWERQKLRDHPVHSVVAVLLTSAVGLVIARKVLERLATRTAQYLPVSQVVGNHEEEYLDSIEGSNSYGVYSPTQSLSPRARRQLFYAALATVIARACILVRVESHTQCSYSGLEVVLLPIVLFIYDYVTSQRLWSFESEDNDMSNDTFDDIYQSLSNIRSRYLMPTMLFSIGVFMTTCLPHPSTYICASSGRGLHVLTLQVIATLLDALLISFIYRLQTDGSREKRKFNVLVVVGFSSGIFIMLASVIYLALTRRLNQAVILDSAYLGSAVWAGLLCATLLVCLEQLIQEVRALNLVTLFLFCGEFARLVLSSRLSRDIFPPHAKSAKVIGFALLFFGFMAMMSFYKTSESKSNFVRGVPKWCNVLLVTGFIVAECLYITAPRYVGFSPINYLMYEARVSAHEWLTQASKSDHLTAAVDEYRRRYGRSPPPLFDKWFDFAMERNAYVIDDYDEMEKTLLPFWAIEPREIRRLTTIQDPDHDIVGFTIRGGVIDVGFRSSRESVWVGDTAAMIRSFSQYLPDMNIGFNIQDAPQVAVPWQEIQYLNEQGQKLSRQNIHSGKPFSQTHEPRWDEFNPDSLALRNPNLSPVKPPYTYVGVFNDVLAPTCPPKSAARKGRLWDVGDFCQHCARPHTIGPYVANWTLSSDFCHQPDMASQHSYLMSQVKSPTERSPRRALTPIFSRKTLPGFNDILFPGPDSYLDSASRNFTVYNDTMLFNEKRNTLYWRGALDNTLTIDSSWKGQESQRLVYSINNATQPIPLLLPSPTRYTYKNVPASELRPLISTDVQFTHPDICTKTCQEQVREFGTVDKPSVSDWWENRYLFSTDINSSIVGPQASTNPTFLQMLASNSLPFHASIFRTWYSSRIIPWLHFVPQDLRYQGIWATAAYFMGLGFTPGMEEGGLPRVHLNGVEMVAEGKTDQANFIARTGKEWVERVVRKDDAEVYMFRLLLEWGRIVDDDRPNIGFILPPPAES